MNEKILESFPVLKTKQLVLRRIEEKDIEGIYKFYSDPQSLKYIARNIITTMDEAVEKFKIFNQLFENKKGIWWAFNKKEEEKFIGFGGFFEVDKEANKAELGYGFLPGNWGKGFGTEAVNILTDFGLNELQLHKLYAYVDPENKGSVRLLEKFGYKREGLFKDHDFAQNKYFDTAVYTRKSN
ncbi:MAG TPA: GNAT family N-acetyltransferase [Ignavibacteriaceae bacterium]